jgi:predicted O-methyltransferase YrrM
MVEDITIDELGIERIVPRRGAVKFESGLMAREIPVFCGIVKKEAPRRAVEIGTWWGLSSEMILEMSPDCEIITIDYKDQKVTRPPELGPPDARIRFLIENSKTVRLPEDWYGATDLVFVDGDHRRNGIVNDTRLAMSLVAPGGLIVWHDLIEPGSDRNLAKGLQSKHKYYVSEYLYNHFPLTTYRVQGTVLGLHRFEPGPDQSPW